MIKQHHHQANQIRSQIHHNQCQAVYLSVSWVSAGVRHGLLRLRQQSFELTTLIAVRCTMPSFPTSKTIALESPLGLLISLFGALSLAPSRVLPVCRLVHLLTVTMATVGRVSWRFIRYLLWVLEGRQLPFHYLELYGVGCHACTIDEVLSAAMCNNGCYHIALPP